MSLNILRISASNVLKMLLNVIASIGFCIGIDPFAQTNRKINRKKYNN